MAITNKVSIQRLLVNIEDTFNLNNESWKSKAIETIGRGLEIIKVSSMFKKTSITKKLIGGKTSLPCDIKTLIQIEYEDCELIINNRRNFIKECANDLPCHHIATGQLNGNILHTNIEQGEVVIYYLSIEVDEEGYPLIPDDPMVFEALEWYVIYKFLLAGNKHHTIKDHREARAMWEEYYPQARNSVKQPSVLQMTKFMNVWLSQSNDFRQLGTYN